MNIKARERLLNALIVVAAIVLLFVVGYPQYKEASPSKVRIGVDKSLGSLPFIVARDGYLVDMILRKLASENISITRVPLQPEELSSALAAGVDALYLLDPYRGYVVYEGNKIILESLISSVHAMPREFSFEKTDFSRKNRS